MDLDLARSLLWDKFTNSSKQCPHVPNRLNKAYFMSLLGELHETVNIKCSALRLTHRYGH